MPGCSADRSKRNSIIKEERTHQYLFDCISCFRGWVPGPFLDLFHFDCACWKASFDPLSDCLACAQARSLTGFYVGLHRHSLTRCPVGCIFLARSGPAEPVFVLACTTFCKDGMVSHPYLTRSLTRFFFFHGSVLDPLNPFFFFNGSLLGPLNPFFARSGTETRKPSTEIKSKAIENELGCDSGVPTRCFFRGLVHRRFVL